VDMLIKFDTETASINACLSVFHKASGGYTWVKKYV